MVHTTLKAFPSLGLPFLRQKKMLPDCMGRGAIQNGLPVSIPDGL